MINEHGKLADWRLADDPEHLVDKRLEGIFSDHAMHKGYVLCDPMHCRDIPFLSIYGWERRRRPSLSK